MHKHQNSDTVHVLTLIVQEVVWDMFCFSAMVTAPKGVSHGQYAGIIEGMSGSTTHSMTAVIWRCLNPCAFSNDLAWNRNQYYLPE